MPRTWVSPEIFTTLVYILLFLHDLHPFSEMFSTRCLWKTLDLALIYTYSTHQAQHQKELAEYRPYNSILVDGEQRQISFTLCDLSDPSCPGYEHCYGVLGTMLKGANTVVKLHIVISTTPFQRKCMHLLPTFWPLLTIRFFTTR